MVMCQAQQGAHDSAVCASDSTWGQIRKAHPRGTVWTPGNLKATHVMKESAQAQEKTINMKATVMDTHASHAVVGSML